MINGICDANVGTIAANSETGIPLTQAFYIGATWRTNLDASQAQRSIPKNTSTFILE
ncbi:hypothetical protein [Sphingobacterium deserti]|uniref:hypothetical protein n=1 Tax=Sphingobacterium deserti TaxID=1229276 RepID=UPI000B29EA13|nr:hypothetical protein [Sphingobacterium deserti]